MENMWPHVFCKMPISDDVVLWSAVLLHKLKNYSL